MKENVAVKEKTIFEHNVEPSRTFFALGNSQNDIFSCLKHGRRLEPVLATQNT
jgi:hypothetical protein